MERTDLYIAKLVAYGLEQGLVPKEERIYTTNLLLDLMGQDSYEEPEGEIGGSRLD